MCKWGHTEPRIYSGDLQGGQAGGQAGVSPQSVSNNLAEKRGEQVS